VVVMQLVAWIHGRSEWCTEEGRVCVCVCVCVYLSMCVWVGVGGWPLADHSDVDVAAEHCTRSPCMMAAARTGWRAHQKKLERVYFTRMFARSSWFCPRRYGRFVTERAVIPAYSFIILSAFSLSARCENTRYRLYRQTLDLSGHFPKIKN